MPSRRAPLQLEESWVVEDQVLDRDEEYSELSPPPKVIRQRAKRSTRSPEPELVMPSLDSSTIDGSWGDTSTRSPRQRRVPDQRKKTAYNSSTEKQVDPRQHTNTRRRTQAPVPGILEVIISQVGSMLSWTWDVISGALWMLKKPISFLFTIWLIFGLLAFTRNVVTSNIYQSLSPICRIPGTSFLNLPFCPGSAARNAGRTAPPVEFEQLMTVQAKFEEVLHEAAGNVGLPMEMKRGEASIRDLRQLVKYSHLHSKNELVLEFDGFIETAKIVSYDLQKFNSHIGRAVDSVLATTRWTTRVLDDMQIRDSSRGAINSFINDKLLAPFQPVIYKESAVLDQYIKHTQLIEEEILKLIDEAQALLMVLNNLEDRLDVISGVVSRDDEHAKTRKEEILSELWTVVGGNRGKLSKMERQLNLLNKVGTYRKTAHGHVAGTILKLQAIASGIEDLRERVGSPELLRDRLHIPLSVHLENIQRGVDRLEESRQVARNIEKEHIEQTLHRGQLEGTLIDG